LMSLMTLAHIQSHEIQNHVKKTPFRNARKE
jgi:hypothetical protein